MIERRSGLASVFARADAGSSDNITITGVGVPFMSGPDGGLGDVGQFVERFAASSFREQERTGFADVTSQFQHDFSITIGSVRAATMQVRATPSALVYTVRLPRSAAFIAETIARGDTAGSSITFFADAAEWGFMPDGQTPLRTVTAATLIEVSPVARPVYKQTSAQIAAGPMGPLRSAPAPAAPVIPMHAGGSAPVVSLEEMGRHLRAREGRIMFNQLMDRRLRLVELEIDSRP